MKIGIYGGTFNPPHLGHLTAAAAVIATLKLDKLLLIPTFIPPHKALPAGAASPAQRHDMAVLAAAVAALGWSEGRSALAALAAVGVYYCVLWLFRHKIEHTIHFSITKHY